MNTDSWMDFGGYDRYDEDVRDQALATDWLKRQNAPRPSFQDHVAMRRTYDYITVDEDGTITAGTIERGTTYVSRPA